MATDRALCYRGRPDQLSLAIPLWVGVMSTRTVTPCSWGVKAGMVRVLVASKTV